MHRLQQAAAHSPARWGSNEQQFLICTHPPVGIAYLYTQWGGGMGRRAQITRESSAGYMRQPSCGLSSFPGRFERFVFPGGMLFVSSFCIVSSFGEVGRKNTFHSCNTATLMSKMNKRNQLGRTLGAPTTTWTSRSKSKLLVQRKTKQEGEKRSRTRKERRARGVHLGACSACDLTLTFYI